MAAIELSRTRTIYNASAVLGIRVGGAGLQLVMVWAVASVYSIEEVGLNGLLWSVALVARMAGPVGLDTTGMKSQAPLWDSGNGKEARALARRDVRALGRVWLILLSIFAILAAGAQVLLGDYGIMIIAFGIVAFVSAMQRIFITQRQAQKKPLLGQFMESILLPTLAIVGVYASAAFARNMFMMSQVLAFILVALLLFFLSPARKLRMCPATEPVPWGVASTLAIGSTLTGLTVKAPMFLMGLQSLTAAGTYEVAQKVQSAGSMGTTSVATVFMPRIVSFMSHSRQLTVLITQAAAMSMIVPLILLCVLLSVGEDGLLSILGDEYAGAWSASVLLMVAVVMNAATSGVSNVLMLGGQQRLYLAISISQLTILLSGATLSGVTSANEIAIWVIVAEGFRSMSLLVCYAMRLRHFST